MKPIKFNMSNKDYTYSLEKKQQLKQHKSLRDAKKGRKQVWQEAE
jgi:hypothetical protein